LVSDLVMRIKLAAIYFFTDIYFFTTTTPTIPAFSCGRQK
jgi:hypothetical protein